MLTFIKIAWRNVWRNPRRSGVVIAAMAVGLWGMYFSLGFNNGMMMQMIENVIGSYLGHIQVHNPQFPARMEGMSMGVFKIEYTIPDPEKMVKIISETPGVKAWTPRMKAMGLITNAEKASGVAISGIDPALEAGVTYISRSIISGGDIRPDHPRDILIGAALAKRLAVDVGSKVVIMTQDINKEKSMSAYNVVGIYRTVSSGFDAFMVYINLGAAQTLLGMPGAVNEIALTIDDPVKSLGAMQVILQKKLGPGVEVIQWKEVWPALSNMVEFSAVMTFIFFILIFIAMAFGIANAVLMSVFERIHELGIMKALGVKPREIFITIAFECMGLSLVGVMAGIILGGATVLYFGHYGMNLAKFAAVLDQMGLGAVVYTRMRPVYFLWGAATALVTAFLSSLWPAARASRLMPVDAIRHV